MARKRTFREKEYLTDEELIEMYYPVSQKTGKRYKKSVGFRVRDNESITLLRWIEYQTNFSESVRYLIEQQLLRDGKIIDLSKPTDLDALFEEASAQSHVSEQSSRIVDEVAATVEEEKDEEIQVHTKIVDQTSKTSIPTKEDNQPIEPLPLREVAEKEDTSTTSVEEDDSGEDYDDLADAWG